jgi:hypothetical protein
LALCSIATAEAGLVSWWPINGNTQDAVGTNHGTWNGTATYSSTVSAPGSTQAADVSDATNPKRYIKAGTGIDFTGTAPFSAMAWIRGGGQDATVIGDMIHGGTYTGWELHVGTNVNGANSTGVVVWLLSNYPSNAIQVNSAVNVLNNVWHQVAFTYDGSKTAAGVKVYVDGVASATTVGLNSLTGSLANGAAAELDLGTRQNGAAHTFTGLIDEAAVFNHALTATEITQSYTAGIASLSAPALVSTTPANGETVRDLTMAEVIFSSDVTGVNAADLLVAGTPATGATAVSSRKYQFTFAQPANGAIAFSWAAGHGIQDAGAHAFPGTGWSVTPRVFGTESECGVRG